MKAEPWPGFPRNVTVNPVCIQTDRQTDSSDKSTHDLFNLRKKKATTTKARGGGGGGGDANVPLIVPFFNEQTAN